MIRELDTVVLVHDLDAYGLTQGDVAPSSIAIRTG